MQVVGRTQITGAKYNPRVISDDARKKLKLGLEKLGLLMPLVWNRTTGRLVGGHQRLDILDKLANGKTDYTLEVAAVELTPAQEVEANILLNNPEAMGTWDLAKLDEAMRTDGLRLEATGFDMGDLYQVLGESPFAQEHAVEIAQLADDMRKTSAQIEAVGTTATTLRDDSRYYVVAVFKDPLDMNDFLDTLELPPNTFQDGKKLRELLAPQAIAKRKAAQEAAAAEQAASIEAAGSVVGDTTKPVSRLEQRDREARAEAPDEEPLEDNIPF